MSRISRWISLVHSAAAWRPRARSISSTAFTMSPDSAAAIAFDLSSARSLEKYPRSLALARSRAVLASAARAVPSAVNAAFWNRSIWRGRSSGFDFAKARASSRNCRASSILLTGEGGRGWSRGRGGGATGATGGGAGRARAGGAEASRGRGDPPLMTAAITMRSTSAAPPPPSATASVLDLFFGYCRVVTELTRLLLESGCGR